MIEAKVTESFLTKASILTLLLLSMGTLGEAEQLPPDSLPTGETSRLLDALEEREATLPPLSPLPESWREDLARLGDELLSAGVHRSASRYEELSPYLYRHARVAGLPVDRIRESGDRSLSVLSALAGERREELFIGALLHADDGAPTDLSEGAVGHALRRAEIELLTVEGLGAKLEVAGRLTEALELASEESGVSGELPEWELVREEIATAVAAGERLTALEREGSGEALSDLALDLASGENRPIPPVGLPESDLLRATMSLSVRELELLLRHEARVAITLAAILDGYRWNLAPSGAQAPLHSRLAILELSHRELQKETVRRRVEEAVRSLEGDQRFQESRALTEELLSEGRNILERYQERLSGTDTDARRWALLSLLAHPYAQRVLHEEGEQALLDATGERVEALYAEVDRRAMELVGLVARRYDLEEWSLSSEGLPRSFDRIVSIRFTLPEEQREREQEIATQLRSAYERAFNLITNPDQNEEQERFGLPPWSMLHGQYVEAVAAAAAEAAPLFQGLEEDLERWFREAADAEDQRAAFPFYYRGYRRLAYAQERWVESVESRLPRRMWPQTSAELDLYAAWTDGFATGEASLYETEQRFARLGEPTVMDAHRSWAARLTEERRRHEQVSRRAVTSALISSLETPPAQEAVTPADLEALLHRISDAQSWELLDPSVAAEELYDRWRSLAVVTLLPPEADVEELQEAVAFSEELMVQGLLSRQEAERFYRELSRRGVEALRMSREGRDE
ncbi:MAG: hypothetical protein ACOC28_03115 [Alkalispirochaetaceae bacterium]